VPWVAFWGNIPRLLAQASSFFSVYSDEAFRLAPTDFFGMEQNRLFVFFAFFTKTVAKGLDFVLKKLYNIPTSPKGARILILFYYTLLFQIKQGLGKRKSQFFRIFHTTFADFFDKFRIFPFL
jgi:hypothetical protein